MNDNEHWHLDKRLNVGHLLTTVTVGAGVIAWALTVENAIAEHEIKIQNNTQEISHTEDRSDRDFERVYKLVSTINDKLDRLIERR